MNIVFFHQRFDPEPEIKGLIFSRKLIEFGCNVRVITSKPYFKNGILYPQYNRYRLLVTENNHGTEIYRVPLVHSHSSSKLGRAVHYLSLALNTFIVGLFTCSDVDCIYVCGPPVSVGLSGFLIAKILNKPVLYDLQDLWPESIQSSGIQVNKFISRILYLWCIFFYKNMSHIVVQSKGIKEILISYGIDENKISVINNWCNENALFGKYYDDDLHKIFNKNRLTIVFAGNIGKAQGLDVLIDVAGKIQSNNMKAQIILIGDGVETLRLKKAALDKKINTITFIEHVPIEIIHSYLSRADLLLIHLKKQFLFTKTIPSKTQAYLASGKPIIICVDGDAKEMILESRGGFYAEPECADSIFNAINEALLMSKLELNKLGENGKNYYFSNMSLEIGASRFFNIFKSLIAK